jgi:hypothetical protein
MVIHPVHRRLAELWTLSRNRKLTQSETEEFDQCLQVNAKLCWEMAYLENLSLLASMTNNIEWQHDICREIDQFPQKTKPTDAT